MRQNEKALLLALISFLSVEQTVRKVPRSTLLQCKVPPKPTIFILFCGKYCPGLLNAPEPHYFLLFLSENNDPDHIYIWLRLPRTPLFFIFLDKKFCPGPAPGHRPPPITNVQREDGLA